jgi:hypothetical protein
MRGIVVLGVAAVALLAGCAPSPQPDPPLGPITIPPELSWQYAHTCFGDDMAPVAASWGPGVTADVHFEVESPESAAIAAQVEACLDQYPYEDGQSDFGFVDPFERAQLYDYYMSMTVPCLARHGIDLDPVARTTFFAPDRRPWNPYQETDFTGVPFLKLYSAYRACPPVPEYLQPPPD